MNSKKIIAALTAFFFLFQTVAFSAPELIQTSLSPKEITPVKLDIDIPQELGQIQKVYQSPVGTGVIVHIQDAHGNYEAQQNIRSVIQHLRDHYGINLLLMEGADDKLDPGVMNYFEDSRLNEKVADILMKYGEFTGAEMFLVSQAAQASGYGIEKTELYRKDVELFRQVIRGADAAKSYLESMQGRIRVLESRIFSKELRDFVKEWRKEQEEKANLLGYINVLAGQAETVLSLDLKDPANQDTYPAMLRVLKLKDIEAKLDAKKIEAEKAALLSEIKGKVDSGLYDAVAQLQAGKKSDKSENPRFVLEKIHSQAKGLDYARYPHFSNYAAYLVFQAEIQSEQLFREAENLTDKLFQTIARSEEEQSLLGLIKDEVLLAKFFKLELSRSECLEIEGRQSEFAPEGFETRIAGMEKGRKNQPVDWTETAKLFTHALEFYQVARDREDYFIENAVRTMKETDETRAVVVTGGFHAEGFEARVKAKGLSYVLVSPRITDVRGSHEIYLNAMLGKTDVSPVQLTEDVKRSFNQDKAQSQVIVATRLEGPERQAALWGNEETDARRRFSGEVVDLVRGQSVEILAQAASLGEITLGSKQNPIRDLAGFLRELAAHQLITDEEAARIPRDVNKIIAFLNTKGIAERTVTANFISDKTFGITMNLKSTLVEILKFFVPVSKKPVPRPALTTPARRRGLMEKLAGLSRMTKIGLAAGAAFLLIVGFFLAPRFYPSSDNRGNLPAITNSNEPVQPGPIVQPGTVAPSTPEGVSAPEGVVHGNPLLANPVLKEGHQTLGRSIVALRTPGGLPYNQTRGAFNPGEGWLKSSDIGMTLAAEIVLAANARVYPGERDFQPAQVTVHVKTILDFYEKSLGGNGLHVQGKQAGILPEFMSYRGEQVLAEMHDIPGTGRRGIPYAAYDMAMTVEWLMRAAEIFKGGVIDGLKDDAVVRQARYILDRTNFNAFIDKDGRLHSQVFLTADSEIVYGPGIIDNKHTEAKMFLPLIYAGYLGDPSGSFSERVGQGAAVWKGMSYEWEVRRIGSRSYRFGRGDGGLSAFTEFYGNLAYDEAALAPNTEGVSHKNYLEAAIALGQLRGHKLFVSAPGTGKNSDEYAQFGINNPSVLVPVGSFLALTTGSSQAADNVGNLLRLSTAVRSYNATWGWPDALDPVTGKPFNEKRIYQNQVLQLLGLNYPVLRAAEAQMPWYAGVSGALRQLDKAHAAPVQTGQVAPAQKSRDLLAAIRSAGAFSQVDSFPGNRGSLVRAKGVIDIQYAVGSGGNDYSGFWGKLDMDATGYQTLRLRLGKDAVLPDKFKVELKRGGQILKAIYTEDGINPGSTIELDIAGVRGKVDEITFVFEGHAAGKNQQGHFTVEELSLVSTPPSGQSLGGSPAQYKPYPPSFRGEGGKEGVETPARAAALNAPMVRRTAIHTLWLIAMAFLHGCGNLVDLIYDRDIYEGFDPAYDEERMQIIVRELGIQPPAGPEDLQDSSEGQWRIKIYEDFGILIWDQYAEEWLRFEEGELEQIHQTLSNLPRRAYQETRYLATAPPNAGPDFTQDSTAVHFGTVAIFRIEGQGSARRLYSAHTPRPLPTPESSRVLESHHFLPLVLIHELMHGVHRRIYREDGPLFRQIPQWFLDARNNPMGGANFLDAYSYGDGGADVYGRTHVFEWVATTLNFWWENSFRLLAHLAENTNEKKYLATLLFTALPLAFGDGNGNIVFYQDATHSALIPVETAVVDGLERITRLGSVEVEWEAGLVKAVHIEGVPILELNNQILDAHTVRASSEVENEQNGWQIRYERPEPSESESIWGAYTPWVDLMPNEHIAMDPSMQWLEAEFFSEQPMTVTVVIWQERDFGSAIQAQEVSLRSGQWQPVRIALRDHELSLAKISLHVGYEGENPVSGTFHVRNLRFAGIPGLQLPDVTGASMGESGYGTRRDFLIRMKDVALLAGAVAVFGPGVLAQEAVRGPVAANPLLARAALQGAHQILGRSIVALRNGAGLPYNQTRGAFNPGEGWLKSSDLGMSLAADIVMAAGASAYPAENNFQPRQVTERVKTLLTFYSRAVGYYGLKVGGSQTGILPEFLSYRGARIVAEEHAIPGTNQRGIPYAAYDMAMTVEWLMRTAEIFKGGVIEGLKDDSVVRLAEGILRQTNLQAFVDKDGRLHSQVFLTARGEIIQSPGVIDNKHTEAKMLLPLIYGGYLGNPASPLAERISQGEALWKGLSFQWESREINGQTYALAVGDGGMSAFTEYYGNLAYDETALAPKTEGVSHKNYLAAAIAVGQEKGHKLFVSAPGTGQNPDEYAQYGINNPSVLVPVGSFLALTTGADAAVSNVENLIALIRAQRGYDATWGWPDSLDPVTGRAFNGKRIFQNQVLQLLGLNHSVLRAAETRMPWHEAVSKALRNLDRDYAQEADGQRPEEAKGLNLMNEINDAGAFTQIGNYPLNSASWDRDKGIIDIEYNLGGGNTYSGAWARLDVDVTGYRTLRIRVDEKAVLPSRFKVELKQGGRILKTVYTEAGIKPGSTIDLNIAGIRGTVDEITFVFESRTAGENQKGYFTIEELSLTTAAPSAKSLGGSPVEYKPYPPSFRGEEIETAAAASLGAEQEFADAILSNNRESARSILLSPSGMNMNWNLAAIKVLTALKRMKQENGYTDSYVKLAAELHTGLFGLGIPAVARQSIQAIQGFLAFSPFEQFDRALWGIYYDEMGGRFFSRVFNDIAHISHRNLSFLSEALTRRSLVGDTIEGAVTIARRYEDPVEMFRTLLGENSTLILLMDSRKYVKEMDDPEEHMFTLIDQLLSSQEIKSLGIIVPPDLVGPVNWYLEARQDESEGALEDLHAVLDTRERVAIEWHKAQEWRMQLGVFLPDWFWVRLWWEKNRREVAGRPFEVRLIADDTLTDSTKRNDIDSILQGEGPSVIIGDYGYHRKNAQVIIPDDLKSVLEAKGKKMRFVSIRQAFSNIRATALLDQIFAESAVASNGPVGIRDLSQAGLAEIELIPNPQAYGVHSEQNRAGLLTDSLIYVPYGRHPALSGEIGQIILNGFNQEVQAYIREEMDWLDMMMEDSARSRARQENVETPNEADILRSLTRDETVPPTVIVSLSEMPEAIKREYVVDGTRDGMTVAEFLRSEKLISKGQYEDATKQPYFFGALNERRIMGISRYQLRAGQKIEVTFIPTSAASLGTGQGDRLTQIDKEIAEIVGHLRVLREDEAVYGSQAHTAQPELSLMGANPYSQREQAQVRLVEVQRQIRQLSLQKQTLEAERRKLTKPAKEEPETPTAESLGAQGIILPRADFLAELKAKGEFSGAVSGGARGHLNIIARVVGDRIVAIEEYLTHYGGVAERAALNVVVRAWDGVEYFKTPLATKELPRTTFGIHVNRIYMDAPAIVQSMAEALQSGSAPDEIVSRVYDDVTAASLGQGAVEALAYSEAFGRALPASILEVAHDVTLDVYHLEGATAVVVHYYREQLGLIEKPEVALGESEAMRAVNEGLLKTQDVLTHLEITPPATRKPVILFVNEVFGADDKKLSPEQVAAMAGKIADGLNKGDLFVGVVDQEQNRLMAKLFEAAGKGQFRAKAMPQALLSDSTVESLAAKLDAVPIALSSLTNAGDAGLKTGNMTRIRFNKKAMKTAGMSLDWAVGLLEQIADNPEALRKLGLRPDSDGFWEAGSGFVALIERVYAEMKAQGKLATAA